jgi:hypothetical protein
MPGHVMCDAYGFWVPGHVMCDSYGFDYLNV